MSRTQHNLAHKILSLAIPALGALIAEPLFTLIDSAMVGHLGTAQLAGLSLGSQILNTLIVLFVFLAYSTTALSARALGAGRSDEALRAGVDAIWLALGLGVMVAPIVALSGPLLVRALGASTEATPYALHYLWASTPGLVGMFIVMAAVGTLRGLQDTRTPLYVTTAGALINVCANAFFIYGLSWGVAGSGIGTSVTQLLMATYLAWRLGKASRTQGVSLLPSRSGLGHAAKQGAPLVVRGIMLRIAGLATLWPVAAAGTTPLAGYQIVLTLWTLAAFVLDALAIAAQAMVGKALGAGQIDQTRQLLRTLTKWGLYFGILVALVLALAAPWLPLLFGSDPAMHEAATWGLIASSIGIPVASVVFILDGVLLGAGDNTYLAAVGIVHVILLLPALAAVEWWRQAGAAPHYVVAAAWLAYSLVYIGARAFTNAWRTWWSPRHSLVARR
ncbi:MATE family efflux transporter [Schaalia suimastitidis]|uniref:MATE family efflux transporter n=1 Tax=Schaalia suimastitidis TaxID=121163 RepID=UPI001F0A5015|nr:MATE family efflux transporter [Schaalia suimastitidis]